MPTDHSVSSCRKIDLEMPEAQLSPDRHWIRVKRDVVKSAKYSGDLSRKTRVPIEAYTLVKMSRMKRAFNTGTAAYWMPMINLCKDSNR